MAIKYLTVISIILCVSIVGCKTERLYHNRKDINIDYELINVINEYINYSVNNKKCNILTDNNIRASLFLVINGGIFNNKYSDVISIFGSPLQIRIFKDGSKSIYYPLSYYVKGENRFSMLYVLFFNNKDIVIPNKGFTLLIETEEDADYWYSESLPNLIKF